MNGICGPWLIDSRSPYDGQSGLHGKPVSLGAVVAEVPTAFDSIVIRDPGTIGKPCPSKEELDRIGLERATAIAALPELMAALETAEAALTGCRPNNQHLPGIRAALAKARPA